MSFGFHRALPWIHLHLSMTTDCSQMARFSVSLLLYSIGDVVGYNKILYITRWVEPRYDPNKAKIHSPVIKLRS